MAASVSIWLQNLNVFAQSDTLERCARYVIKSSFFFSFFSHFGFHFSTVWFGFCFLEKCIISSVKRWFSEWWQSKFKSMQSDNDLSAKKYHQIDLISKIWLQTISSTKWYDRRFFILKLNLHKITLTVSHRSTKRSTWI